MSTIKTKLRQILFDVFESESTFTAFQPVKIGSADNKATSCTPDDADCIGWAHYAVTTVGKQVEVILNTSPAIIPVTVGTSQTATMGKMAVGHSAGGYKDGPALTSGSTLAILRGRFMSSGSSGQAVSLLVMQPTPVFTA